MVVLRVIIEIKDERTSSESKLLDSNKGLRLMLS